jgi:hypothetical protein
MTDDQIWERSSIGERVDALMRKLQDTPSGQAFRHLESKVDATYQLAQGVDDGLDTLRSRLDSLRTMGPPTVPDPGLAHRLASVERKLWPDHPTSEQVERWKRIEAAAENALEAWLVSGTKITTEMLDLRKVLRS